MATIQERLEARLQRADNGCLEWRGSTQPTGYGQIWADKTMKYTHRVAWELAKGRIPDGMMVCHTCDNRLCCDVDHLFLGTAADNNADMCAKGRQARGLAFPLAKLTQDDNAEIIRL